MAEVIIMPKLGFNMDEGMLVKWCIQQGNPVKQGEPLFEIETDKTVMPVEATHDGILLKTLLGEGEYADVFTPIAVVGQEGEDPDAALLAAKDGDGKEQDASADALPGPAGGVADTADTQTTQQDSMDNGGLKLTPKAQTLLKEKGWDPALFKDVKGTGFRDGITAKDIKASPLARKLAEKIGVDLGSITGSGAEGKIMKADVMAASGAVPDAKGTKRIDSATPYKGVRKIIGDRLAQSKFTAPHLYFTESVDLGAFMAMRKKINESGDQKIAVADLLVKAACKALQQYPGVNVSLLSEEIVRWHDINIGLAVAGDNGLIVPVVKHVQEKTLSAIAGETRDLVERARAGRLAQEEFSDGTFTISNLGMFGIENFTAIINPPEAAILAVSSVRKKVVAVTDEEDNDTMAIRPMMNIQLTVDHRLIDGLLAAQFVAGLKNLLENPLGILL